VPANNRFAGLRVVHYSLAVRSVPILPPLLLLLPLASSAVVYYPLTTAYFASDDFLNLYLIVNESPLEYVLRPHGGHLLVTRNAIFSLFHQAFGTRAELYFWAVLLTHLVNVFLLFQIIRRLAASNHLASFGATLWGICPVHAGALGWYSVYGHVVVTTIVLVILNRAAAAVSTGSSPSRSVLLLWPLLFLVASTCFGVGIGITVVSPLMLFLLLPPSPVRTRLCVALCAVAVALPFVYQELLRLYGAVSGSSRALLVATFLTARTRPSWHLVEFAAMLASHGITSLLLGFALPVKTTLGIGAYVGAAQFPGAIAYVVAGSYVALVLVVLVRSPGTIRRRVLGFLAMATGCYAIIAAGRAPAFTESVASFGAAQPRYHYAATTALTILLCLTLREVAAWLPWTARIRSILLLTWVAVTAVCYMQSPPFIDPFASARKETTDVLTAVDKLIAAAPPRGDVYIPNKLFLSAGPMIAADPVTFPGWAAIFTIFFPSNVVDGKRVHFIVNHPEAVAAAMRGRRTAELVIGPDQVRRPEGARRP